MDPSVRMSQLLQIIIEQPPAYDHYMEFITLYNQLEDKRTKTLYEKDLNDVFQALKELGYPELSDRMSRMSELLKIIIEQPTYDDCMEFITLYNQLDELTKTVYEQNLNKVVFQALEGLGCMGYTRGGLAFGVNLKFLKKFSPHSTAAQSSEPFRSVEPPSPLSDAWNHLRLSQVPPPAHSSGLPAEDPLQDRLTDYDASILDDTRGCRHGKLRQHCKDCGKFCPHGKLKWHCKECGKFCPHGKLKWHCKECGGSNFCQHGRQKSRCKECGGVGICQHDREKRNCKICGGTNICQHGMLKYNCIDCKGTNKCKHGREKRFCRDCGGSGICNHGNNKRYCKVCNSQGGSKTIKSKKSYRNVKMSFRKNKKVVAHKKTKRLKSSSASSRKSHVYI
jgi:hypothetical protein